GSGASEQRPGSHRSEGKRRCAGEDGDRRHWVRTYPSGVDSTRPPSWSQRPMTDGARLGPARRPQPRRRCRRGCRPVAAPAPAAVPATGVRYVGMDPGRSPWHPSCRSSDASTPKRSTMAETVRIDPAAHATLTEIARAKHIPLTEALSRAVEAYRRQVFL